MVNGIVNMVLLQHPTVIKGLPEGVGWGGGAATPTVKTVVNDSSFFVAFASLVDWL